jgi:hypothetical protein
MTTARNFSRKFAEHPLELSPEIASRYFPCHQGLLPLHGENRKEPDGKPMYERRQSREKMDIEEKKLVNMNYLSD